MSRPITVKLSPAAANLAAIAANQNLTSGTPMTLASSTFSDGLARKLAITTAASITGTNLVIVGLDENGVAITETVAGPASATTVYSVLIYSSVTSITPSASNAVNVKVGFDGTSSVVASIGVALEHYDSIAAQVVIEISGTANVTVQEAFDNVITQQAWTPITWFATPAALTAITASGHAQIDVGVTAIRVLINSYSTSATVTLLVRQPSRGAQ